MSELSEFLSQNGEITCSFMYLGFELKTLKDGDNWGSHDCWKATVSYNGKNYTTEYKTGLGHRKVATGVKRAPFKNIGQFSYSKGSVVAHTEEDAARLKLTEPVQPELADVLYCLLSDASGSDEMFDDWCSNLGYNTDSRKALDTYLKCQETRKHLIQMFGHNLFNEMRHLEH
jgi:hypothetical protein